MDETRYDQLIEKRGATGLSDAEANELGRLIAEKAGRTDDYANAQERRGGPPPDDAVRGPAAPPPEADPGGDPAQQDAAGVDGDDG